MIRPAWLDRSRLLSCSPVLSLLLCGLWPGGTLMAGSQATAQPQNPWIYESDVASARAGYITRGIGDINGDGFADVGATRFGPVDTSTGLRTETVMIFAGARAGLPARPTWSIVLEGLTDSFNAIIAGAGDVNQDGYDDLLVGAPNYNPSSDKATAGGAFLFLGGMDGPVSPAARTVVGLKKDDRLGTAVAGIGDFNGDGFPDVAIGAPYAESGETNEGFVYIYAGESTGLSADPLVRFESGQVGAQLGCLLASAGDLNLDGKDDLLTTACWYDNPEQDEGQARVYYGTSGTHSGVPDWTVDGDASFTYAGTSLSGGGDFNGDGFPDVAVGLLFFDDQQLDSGMVRLYGGKTGGIATTTFWSSSQNQESALWGQGLQFVQDLTGDGIDDLLISSGKLDQATNNKDTGRVSLYEGKAGTPSTTPVWSLNGDKASAGFGTSVDFAGDTNGDGCLEIAIGAPGYANPETSEGRIYVYTADSRDSDSDGYCPGTLPLSDCNDSDPSTHPGATEVVGDGIDQDCDGAELCFVDADQDGYYPSDAASVPSSDLSCSSPGMLPLSTDPRDCEDADGSIYPGATEVCNYKDDDCDNLKDEDVTLLFYQDLDNDKYGNPSEIRDDCAAPQGYVADNTDCDDTNPAINPGMLEVTADGLDQNCDGQEQCYLDADSDGYRPDVTSTVLSADLDCDDPGEASASRLAGDCDDANPNIHPGVLETCDNIDNDCDSILDEGTAIDCPTGDFDQDGYTEQGGDCNDQLDGVNPGATESCDALDNDCDGVVDEGDVCATPTPDTDGGGCGCRTESTGPGAPLSSALLLLVLLAGMRRRHLSGSVARRP